MEKTQCCICKEPFQKVEMIKSRFACKSCWQSYMRERRYGITPEKFQSLLVQQDYKCAICKNIDNLGKQLAVDHDKTTGQIRGLLCGKCNRGIGYLNHDKGLFEEAIKYLSVRQNNLTTAK